MKVYTVHHRSGTAEGVLDDPEGMTLVKDGFSWPAFFIPAFWLIYKRMWIVLALYLAASAIIAVLLGVFAIPQLPGFLIGLALNLVMGMEGNDLLRWTLARRGLEMVAVTVGRDLVEAEHRAFEVALETVDQEPEPEPRAPAGPARRLPQPPPASSSSSLFPEPGGAP